MFHAMFAYTETGREDVAIQVFGLIVASSLVCNFMLQYFRAGVPWWGLAGLNALAGTDFWLEVAVWLPVSPEFSQLVVVLTWSFPVACLISSLGIHWAVRRCGETHEGSQRQS